jgi:RNA polymerase subunit RPABC4/transcription elongation factor Spt4
MNQKSQMISVPNIARKNAEVTGYSLEELEHFRKEFSAEVKAHQAKERRFVLPILFLIVVGLGVVFYFPLLFQPPLIWLLVAGFALVVAGIIFMAITAATFQQKLICPACHNDFIGEMQECCPECGSFSLGPQNWRGARHCNACRKNLRFGKNRNFKYKACTNCGVFLYAKGL